MGQAAENGVLYPTAHHSNVELRLVLCDVFWEDIGSMYVPQVKRD